MATNFLNPGTYTIGPNNTIAILDQNNNEIPIGLATQISWNADPVTNRIPVNQMNGISQDVIEDRGWRGEIVIARSNGDLDVFWSTLETEIRAGLIRPTYTIIQNVNETDGSVSQMTFYACALTYDAGGMFSLEEVAMQKLSFTSPARVVTNSAGG